MYGRIYDWRSHPISSMHAYLSYRLHWWLADAIFHMPILYGTCRCSSFNYIPNKLNLEAESEHLLLEAWFNKKKNALLCKCLWHCHLRMKILILSYIPLISCLVALVVHIFTVRFMRYFQCLWIWDKCCNFYSIFYCLYFKLLSTC